MLPEPGQPTPVLAAQNERDGLRRDTKRPRSLRRGGSGIDASNYLEHISVRELGLWMPLAPMAWRLCGDALGNGITNVRGLRAGKQMFRIDAEPFVAAVTDARAVMAVGVRNVAAPVSKGQPMRVGHPPGSVLDGPNGHLPVPVTRRRRPQPARAVNVRGGDLGLLLDLGHEPCEHSFIHGNLAFPWITSPAVDAARGHHASSVARDVTARRHRVACQRVAS